MSCKAFLGPASRGAIPEIPLYLLPTRPITVEHRKLKYGLLQPRSLRKKDSLIIPDKCSNVLEPTVVGGSGVGRP